MGIVNGSSSLIEKLTILANGRDVYSCNYANHVVNIKNLLEYNPSYVDSVATNEFYHLDIILLKDQNLLSITQM